MTAAILAAEGLPDCTAAQQRTPTVPTCFLRSSGKPAPPQAGGCAAFERSGCLAPPAPSSAAGAPQPLLLLIKFTVGSLPLFSFLQQPRNSSRGNRGLNTAYNLQLPLPPPPPPLKQDRYSGSCRLSCMQEEPHSLLAGQVEGLGGGNLAE